jgi:hypothetical protein
VCVRHKGEKGRLGVKQGYLFTASFHCSVPRPTDSTIRASDAASAIAASTPTITLELLTMSPLWKDLRRREEMR